MKYILSTTDWLARHEYVCLALIFLGYLLVSGL